MKIISYNVNGLRAAINKGLLDWITQNKFEIICLQEIKIQEAQLPLEKLESLGYHHYWFPAEKKGYSGVGLLSKEKPLHVSYGTGISYMDREGRSIRIDLKECSIMSLYIPSGSNIEKRLEFKLQFMKDFYTYIKELKKKIPNLILSGDYNICHEAMDIHDPIRNAHASGFLPEERQWLSEFLKLGFVDSFRSFTKAAHHYSWWSYRAGAKPKNKGWRIDYHLVSETLKEKMKNAYHLPSIMHSDHCPVALEMDF